MAVIITYDVSDKQSQVKDAMLAEGYTVRFTHSGKQYNLPYTTLFRYERTHAQAVADLEAVCRQQKVRLLHCLALEIYDGTFSAISGEEYSS